MTLDLRCLMAVEWRYYTQIPIWNGLFYNNKSIVALEIAPCLHLNDHIYL